MSARRRDAGFTLVELLVASTIFFTFTVGVLSVYARSHATFVRGQTRMESRQNARIAVETLAHELRIAGYDPSAAVDRDAGESIVTAADTDSLTFVGDVDGDGVSERVEYRRVADRLERGVARWTGSAFGSLERDVLAAGVEGFELRYFDGSAPAGRELGLPVASGELDSIRRVAVRVMTAHEIAAANSRYPLELDVMLRNAGGTP